MELVIALAMKFWQWSILIALIILGFVINLFDKKIDNNRVNFKYTNFPHMKPIPIKTKGKGFWKGILMWLLGTRHWEIVKDFDFQIEGKKSCSNEIKCNSFVQCMFANTQSTL